ncbi:MAG: hypothetical protein KDA75_21375, partial [Planctomycetaceae bacterium]|nr:hypothetical protein [Planctomycetaceae bacterium]
MYVLRNYACSLLTVALLLAGCGQSGELDRRAVEGSVQVNGDALARGQIVFAPQPGTVGPAGSAVIDAGKFAIDADSGLVPGEYRVEIQAL